MNGRAFFDKFSSVIDLLSAGLAKLPSPVFSLLMDVLSPYSGKLSVLIRYCLISKRLKKCGKNFYIGRWVTLKNIHNMEVGENVSIHDGCYIDAIGGLNIGSSVSIAHQTSILTFNHRWDNSSVPIKYNPITSSCVRIDDDVWIGCGVRLMPGVTLGSRSVVAAGSVVTRDVKSGSVVAGVPAKVIKKIL